MGGMVAEVGEAEDSDAVVEVEAAVEVKVISHRTGFLEYTRCKKGQNW